MRCDSPENSSSHGFGVETPNSSSSRSFGIETSNSSSSGGFGVESPSRDPNSNYEGIVGSGVESVRNMLNINTGNTQGITGGQVYSGNINSSYSDDSIEDLYDDIEVGSVQSWIESGSIVGSAIKIVSDLYNKYFLSETKSIGNVVSDIDNTIVSAIEEISSGSWDSSYRNIQLDGCSEGNMVESDEREGLYFGGDCNGDQINGSAVDILSASGAGNSSSD